MQNVFKRFGAKDTGSFERQFNHSLLRLTLFYATTLAVILSVSVGITYSTFSSRLGRRFNGVPRLPASTFWKFSRPGPCRQPNRSAPT